MTDQPIDDAARPAGGPADAEPTFVNDRRRIDPESGQVRQPAAPGETAPEAVGEVPDVPADAVPDDASSLDDAAATLAAERLADLQRLQAEYVNYRRRVERDRDVAKDRAISGLLESMLPVLDDIELARQHGDLDGGPFAAIAEKLEGTLGRFGLARYGDTGTTFDPEVHEALLHSESDEVTEPTVTQVLQPGYMIKEKVLRAARVAVTAPTS